MIQMLDKSIELPWLAYNVGRDMSSATPHNLFARAVNGMEKNVHTKSLEEADWTKQHWQEDVSNYNSKPS